MSISIESCAEQSSALLGSCADNENIVGNLTSSEVQQVAENAKAVALDAINDVDSSGSAMMIGVTRSFGSEGMGEFQASYMSLHATPTPLSPPRLSPEQEMFNATDTFLRAQPWQFQRALGAGSCGVVKEYTHGKGRFAVKLLRGGNDSFICQRANSPLPERGEALSLYVPDHPHLLKTERLIIYNRDKKECRILDRNQALDGSAVVVGTVTEAVPSAEDLVGVCSKQNTTSPTKEMVQDFTRQVAGGLGALHAHGIAHRDIKPANILQHTDSDAAKNYKLIDFGTSRNLRSLGEHGKTNSHVGTHSYMSPEVMHGTEYDPKQTDMWSLGVLIYHFAFGAKPSYAYQERDLSSPHERPVGIFRDLNAFGKSGQTIEEFDRPWISERFEKSPLTQDQDFWGLLNGLIRPKDDRLTCAQVLEHPFLNSIKSPGKGGRLE